MQLLIKGEISDELVPRHHPRGTMPSYYIFGGVVFTPLSCGLLDLAAEGASTHA